MIPLLNNLAAGWWPWVVAVTIQSTLLIGVVWVVDRLIGHRLWPEVRYGLWLLVLIKLMMPPGLASPLAFDGILPDAVYRVSSVPLTGEQVIDETILPDAVPGEEVNQTGTSVSSEETEYQQTRQDVSLSPYAVIMIVWGVIVALLATLAYTRYVSLRKNYLSESHDAPPEIRDTLTDAARLIGTKRVPRIVLTPDVASPGVFGVIRPILLLPMDTLQKYDRNDLRNILVHELAHIGRGDLMLHAVFTLLQAVYWFNPFVWLTGRKLRGARELACDATVMKYIRKTDSDYARTLRLAAEHLLQRHMRVGLGFLGLLEDGDMIITRLEALRKSLRVQYRFRVFGSGLLMAVLVILVLPMGGIASNNSRLSNWWRVQAEGDEHIAALYHGLDSLSVAHGEFLTHLAGLPPLDTSVIGSSPVPLSIEPPTMPERPDGPPTTWTRDQQIAFVQAFRVYQQRISDIRWQATIHQSEKRAYHRRLDSLLAADIYSIPGIHESVNELDRTQRRVSVLRSEIKSLATAAYRSASLVSVRDSVALSGAGHIVFRYAVALDSAQLWIRGELAGHRNPQKLDDPYSGEGGSLYVLADSLAHSSLECYNYVRQAQSVSHKRNRADSVFFDAKERVREMEDQLFSRNLGLRYNRAQ